jgi:hypothetical protein
MDDDDDKHTGGKYRMMGGAKTTQGGPRLPHPPRLKDI